MPQGHRLADNQELLTRLGVVTDVQLAIEYGVTPAAIRHLRTRLGIAATPAHLRRPHPGPTSSDAEILERAVTAEMGAEAAARLHGLHPDKVRAERARRGIAFDARLKVGKRPVRRLLEEALSTGPKSRRWLRNRLRKVLSVTRTHAACLLRSAIYQCRSFKQLDDGRIAFEQSTPDHRSSRVQ